MKEQSDIFELGNSGHPWQTKFSFPMRNRSQVVAGKSKTSFSPLFLPFLPPLRLFFETRSHCVASTGITLSTPAGLDLTETHQALLPKCRYQGRAPATLAFLTFVLNLTPLAPFALPTHAFFFPAQAPRFSCPLFKQAAHQYPSSFLHLLEWQGWDLEKRVQSYCA